MLSFLPLVAGRVQADDGGMFSVHCESHGSEVLLFTRNIEAVVNDEHGVVVLWRCTCGHRGALRTGVPRTPAAA